MPASTGCCPAGCFYSCRSGMRSMARNSGVRGPFAAGQVGPTALAPAQSTYGGGGNGQPPVALVTLPVTAPLAGGSVVTALNPTIPAAQYIGDAKAPVKLWAL